MKIPQAREIILQEESQKLIDIDKVIEKAVRITEQNGIIFLDELDKDQAAEIQARGVSTLIVDTVMKSPDDRERLARELLTFFERNN